MPTTLAQVDVCNVALAKIGAQSINSLTDQTSAASIVCNQCFNLAYLEVSRTTRWNCLLNTAVLVAVVQTPLASTTIPPPSSFVNWAPNTFFATGLYLYYGSAYYVVLTGYTSSSSFAVDLSSGNIQLYNTNGFPVTPPIPWAPQTYYSANAFLSYGNYFYTVNFAYTSSNNFTNDLTAGYLVQTDQQAGQSTTDAFQNYGSGSMYASGWAFAYQLPSDFQLLDTLNDNVGSNWGYGDNSSNYEIMGSILYCDSSQAVIQYVPNQPDTTQWDAMFLNCVTLKLASMIATSLRQDGGAMERALLGGYQQALREARSKNGGEKQARRFNPIQSSRFNQARYGGING